MLTVLILINYFIFYAKFQHAIVAENVWNKQGYIVYTLQYKHRTKYNIKNTCAYVNIF